MYLHQLSQEDRQELNEQAERPPKKLCEVEADVVDYLCAVATLRDGLVRELVLLQRKAEDLTWALERKANLDLPQESAELLKAASVLVRLACRDPLREAEEYLDKATYDAYTEAKLYMDDAEPCMREADSFLRKARSLMLEAEVRMEV